MPVKSSALPALQPRWALIIEGLLVAAAGILAIAFPLVAGWTATIVAGWTLLGVGVLRAVGAFSRQRPERLRALSAAALTLVLAALILYAPGVGAISATLLIAVYLVAEGMISFLEGTRRHSAGVHGWLWACAAGLADWLLAALLILSSALNAAIALGLVLGFSLISGGVALASIGAAARSTRAA